MNSKTIKIATIAIFLFLMTSMLIFTANITKQNEALKKINYENLKTIEMQKKQISLLVVLATPQD